MVYIWCNNEACSSHAKEEILVKRIYKYENGKSVLANVPRCPICGKEMSYREEIPESTGEINVTFSMFNSKSNEEKSEVLKKRYHEGMKKDHISEVIEEKRKRATKQFFGLD